MQLRGTAARTVGSLSAVPAVHVQEMKTRHELKGLELNGRSEIEIGSSFIPKHTHDV
jgi:hypothetical protein